MTILLKRNTICKLCPALLAYSYGKYPGTQRVKLYNLYHIIPTTSQLCSNDDSLAVTRSDGVTQHLVSLIVVDERSLCAELAQAEPQERQLRPVLHQQSDAIALLHTFCLKEVSHLVAIVLYLKKETLCTFEKFRQELWVK